MALSPYIVTVITKEDAPFNVIPNATIEIRDRLSNGTSGSLSLIFEDQLGVTPITQTGATADTNGQFVFYAAAAEYNAVYQSQTVPVDVGVTTSGLAGLLINDLSQTYEFSTSSLMTGSTETFPLGKPLKVLDIDSTYIVTTGSSTNIGSPDLINTGFAKLQETDGNVFRYGAVAIATDNTIACQAAINDVNKLLIPKDSTIFAVEVIVKDGTYITNRGTIKLKANQAEWARVLTNIDKTNGNIGVVIDNTGGLLDGNRDNQAGSIVQHFGLFIECRDFEIFGGKFGFNKASEVVPSNSPDGPFNQGIPFGEGVSTNPTIGFFSFMGGRNNNTHDFLLVDWAQEGISTRWNEDSSTTNFKAINGPETSDLYYSTVDFGSRAGSVTVAIDDQVLVQELHEFGGVEQQPHLIYKALVAGTYDLSAEDYGDAGRWTLVERVITNDLGFTAARHAGARGQMNIIAHGYAAYCRAASFSSDCPMNGMHDLYSYHNSFQPGINFGHTNTGSDSSLASNLTAINAGWSGGVGGNSFGINLVGATRDAQISNFYVCGAGRNGINQSDSGKDAKLLSGIVKFSGAGGIKTSSQKMTCSHVTSRNNVGDDFEPTGAGFIVLDNCLDSRGTIINNDKYDSIIGNAQERTTMYGVSARRRRAFRGSVTVAASDPIVTITAIDSGTDVMMVSLTFIERNSGSGVITNQFAIKENFLIQGSGTARNIVSMSKEFSQLRQFRGSWDVPTETLTFYLQDLAGPTDVSCNVSFFNSIYVEIQNGLQEYDIKIS